MPQAGALRVDYSPPPFPLRIGQAGRHLVDVTLFFAPTSGGVRRYLLAKHEWLTQHARLTPDLIEVGDPYHLAHHALRVARERRIPAIAFCHSDVATLATSLFGRWAGRATKRYLSDLYARFDLVLAPSRGVAERLGGIGVRNVEVQTLGVDVTTFHPDARDPELRAMLGIARDARLLVFAGRLSPEKHVGDLVAAMRLLGPRYHLLLIGGDQVMPRAPNVTALGYQQDDRQLARLLASSDVFVHAGVQETFGLVVLEAMACAVPVVAARAGALPEKAAGRAARKRAEAHDWDTTFTRLMARHSQLMTQPASLERQLRRVG
jgi:alpha-1,6-mannosyltransferase